MLVTLLGQRDQLSHPVNAQLGASLHHLPALGRGNWDEQRAPGPVLDFVAWAHAAPARQQPDHAEVPTVERMARVDDRHLRRTGHVSFTGGDVPVGLRWMVSIGRGSHRDQSGGRFGWGDLIDSNGETGSDPVTFRYAAPP